MYCRNQSTVCDVSEYGNFALSIALAAPTLYALVQLLGFCQVTLRSHKTNTNTQCHDRNTVQIQRTRIMSAQRKTFELFLSKKII
jgi:hypothetical protein